MDEAAGTGDTSPMLDIPRQAAGLSPSGRAEAEQLAASNPEISAFVAAHAGTGKTKLLIDRLLRLMLAGADPGRILCLTYTRAAAAEMAIRLQRRLGSWATMEPAKLDLALANLDVAPTPEAREQARRLFTQVLDLPGGMRIGTIHAFCQSLLRRFPLEARISPHFRVVEQADARATLEQLREASLPQADPATLRTLAGLVGANDFANLVASLEAERDRLAPACALPAAALHAAMRGVAGAADCDEAGIIRHATSWPGEAELRRLVGLASSKGSDATHRKAENILGWLNLPPPLRQEHWQEWVSEFLLDGDVPRGLGCFANPKLAALHPEIRDACAAEQQRIAAVQDQRRALAMAQASLALLSLATPILHAYGGARERQAWLDYDDLIGRTVGLLADHGVAWVLYKLDGGLDHLLLDEVQDTAPEQWEIARGLTGDFFAGSGARNTARTVFAVGDRKQSIYSFQGADPEEFDRARLYYRRAVEGSGQTFFSTVLDVSFRSAAPVLTLVDTVFADPVAAIGVREADTTSHIAHRLGQAGSVELWPLAPRPDAAPPTPWTIPHANQIHASAPQTLVRELARWIAQKIAAGTPLESRGRPVRPGDFLVLVRRRGPVDRALVRALKDRGVAVAGLDRMVLTEQPAVQDLLALCEALLLPQDDLSFAEMLVSPLGGLADDSLMALAPNRETSLWDALRQRADERPDWRQAADFFATLLKQVDFAAPYALMSEALGRLGGRARLFARLGPEAAEPIDELLGAASQFAAAHPPSLQGFLHWLRQSAAEVKRQPGAAGDAVRIMTVHGAKGLEAPIVILPDTTSLAPDDARLHWAQDLQTGVSLPLWSPNKDLRCAAVDRLRATAAMRRGEEYNRLLYVALTRAQDHVLVCGWQPHKAAETAWYPLVERAMRSLGAQTRPFEAWPGEALLHSCPQNALPEAARPAAVHVAPPLPAWAGAAPDWQPASPPPEPPRPARLAPSRPDGIRLGPVPAARSPLASGRTSGPGRGVLIHELLQHLPSLPQPGREAAALAYLAATLTDSGEAQELATQAMAVLDDPALAPLFGPGSRAEQPISGVVGDEIVTGQVDRLAIFPNAVWIADYKTGRACPASPQSVPVLYLRQMAAYRSVLAAIFPDREIRCLLVWTEGPTAMQLPPDLLDRHAPHARP